jgi:hypothetical protein
MSGSTFFHAIAIFTTCAAVVASAQPIAPGQLLKASGPNQGSNAIGPDGTYYALVPAAGSTMQTPMTDLVAIGPPSAPATKWSATLSGEIGQILPGTTDVYVVQTVVTGSGRSATSTTSVLVLSVASGSQGTPITPAGTIEDIEVRTITGSTGTSSDYLYIQTVMTSSTTSGGTTTVTRTQTLSIYSNGTLVKSVTL